MARQGRTNKKPQRTETTIITRKGEGMPKLFFSSHVKAMTSFEKDNVTTQLPVFIPRLAPLSNSRFPIFSIQNYGR